jgi:hypothetical protein
MTKQDRQKVSILVVLLAVLGLTVFLGYRMNRPATTSAVVQAPAQKVSTNLPSASGAKIRLDLVEKEEADQDIGKRDVFQYRQAPPPPPPPGPQRGVTGPFGSGPGGFPGGPGSTIPQVVTAPPQGPPKPPPPPPITLKYQGFAARSTPSGGFTAFLADDSRHYNVTVGEILMGKYRIAGITDKSVDVEDLENNRRQSLPLLK